MSIDSSDLRKIQEYIWQKNIDRGFSRDTVEQKMLLLTEEVGELAKAVRGHVGMGFSSSASKNEAAEEVADVLIVLLGLASRLDIDIYQALIQKELKNEERTWS